MEEQQTVQITVTILEYTILTSIITIRTFSTVYLVATSTNIKQEMYTRKENKYETVLQCDAY